MLTWFADIRENKLFEKFFIKTNFNLKGKSNG